MIKDLFEPKDTNEMPMLHRQKKIIFFCLCVALVVIFSLFYQLRQFTDYDIKNTYERVDSAETSYVEFKNNLLRYSKDGAFYTGYDGDLIWNYTYEMSDPTVDTCGNYILIYDKKGTQLAILTASGFRQSIKASMPIVDANISARGTVAILMQEDDTGYIQLCDDSGSVLASGELHMENSGYPMALDISDTGENMVVSQLDLNNNDIKTTLSFYNFGKNGKEQIDNIVATYSFSGQIFPEVAYLKNDRAVAFGSSETVLFNNDAKVTIAKEIFSDGQTVSVFYDDSYFGTICNTTDDEGNYLCQMRIYSARGFMRCKTSVDPAYTDVQMLSNHEICLSNYKDVELYTLWGIRKLSCSFDGSIYQIIPGDGSRRYYFIEEGNTRDVRLK
jgi:hypothetical protein